MSDQIYFVRITEDYVYRATIAASSPDEAEQIADELITLGGIEVSDGDLSLIHI